MFTVKLFYGKEREPLQSAIIHEAEKIQYARGKDYHLITLFKGGAVSAEMSVYDNSDGVVYIENANGKTIQTFEAHYTIDAK